MISGACHDRAMPELPEVETFKRYIERTSLRRPMVHLDVRNDLIIRGIQRMDLIDAVEGGELLSARRHGKWLFLELSGGGWLTWHFGMTGRPVFFEGEFEPRFARALFRFQHGALAFVDPRMLGRLGLTGSPDEFIKERRLGPDALDITLDRFVETFRSSRGPVKTVLMDQRKLAGVGNLYSDEVLFQCRLDPPRDVRSLSEQDLVCMHRAMRRVLKRSVLVGTDFDLLPRSYLLRVRGRGARCPRCGSVVQTVKLGGRTSYYCPGCV